MYNKTIGRINLEVSDEGMKDPNYGHGARLSCPTGWNDSCPIQTHVMCVEELRDLHYLISRALDLVDSGQRNRNHGR